MTPGQHLPLVSILLALWGLLCLMGVAPFSVSLAGGPRPQLYMPWIGQDQEALATPPATTPSSPTPTIPWWLTPGTPFPSATMRPTLTPPPDTYFAVASPAGPVPPGQAFDVPITVETSVEIRGLHFSLRYDPTLVQCEGVSEGPFLHDWAVAHGGTTFFMSGAISNTLGLVQDVRGGYTPGYRPRRPVRTGAGRQRTLSGAAWAGRHIAAGPDQGNADGDARVRLCLGRDSARSRRPIHHRAGWHDDAWTDVYSVADLDARSGSRLHAVGDVDAGSQPHALADVDAGSQPHSVARAYAFPRHLLWRHFAGQLGAAGPGV